MAGIKDLDPQLTAPQQLRVLAEQQAALAPSIREYVRGQVDIWRQIPNWVLEADGRSGYGYSNPYEDFTYTIYDENDFRNQIGSSGGRTIELDLRTGELKGPDDSVVEIGKSEGAFDAQVHLDNLKQRAEREYFGGYDPRKIAQWRADIRAQSPFLTETLDPSLSLDGQVERLRGIIAEIENAAKSPDSQLTPEQVKNAIAHVLRASNFDDQEQDPEPIEIDAPAFNEARAMGVDVPPMFFPPRQEIRGAQEVMQCVAFYIETRSPQFAPLFAKLSERIWHTAVYATAKVRHERGMAHHRESEWIYAILGEEYIKRADGNEWMFAEPRTESLQPDTEIGTHGILTAQKVADWFLDTPAEE